MSEGTDSKRDRLPRTLMLIAFGTVPLVAVGLLLLSTDAERPWLAYTLFVGALILVIAVLVGHFRKG